jgi:catechol 2,3-dioxygenase-like lactoylglutathione lyase family enzyme
MKSDWEFDHIGLVVRDLDEVLAYYPSLGIGVDIGPLGNGAVWPVPGSPEEEPEPTTMMMYGKPFVNRPRLPVTEGVSVNRIIENLQVGSLVIECIRGRPDGNGMNDDFFRDYGEGISHICYNVPDPEKETDELVAKGTDIVMSLERRGKIAENYLGTSKYGNIWLSFRPPAEKWHKAWQAHNRAHPLVSSWKFRGMGVATIDLDKAAEYYQHLGIATLQPEEMLDSSSSRNFKVHGLTGSVVKARTRTVMVGSVAYEFAQTLERETTYGEFLSRRGDGVYSLDFTVDNLEKETARLMYRGIHIVLSGIARDGSAFAYFDTRKVGNLLVKLVQT